MPILILLKKVIESHERLKAEGFAAFVSSIKGKMEILGESQRKKKEIFRVFSCFFDKSIKPAASTTQANWGKIKNFTA